MKTKVWTAHILCALTLMMLSGCANTLPAASGTPPPFGTTQTQATIYALQKRLHDRERTIAIQHYQIEVMASQLEALKRIDQDTRVQRRPVSNLTTVTP